MAVRNPNMLIRISIKNITFILPRPQRGFFMPLFCSDLFCSAEWFFLPEEMIFDSQPPRFCCCETNQAQLGIVAVAALLPLASCSRELGPLFGSVCCGSVAFAWNGWCGLLFCRGSRPPPLVSESSGLAPRKHGLCSPAAWGSGHCPSTTWWKQSPLCPPWKACSIIAWSPQPPGPLLWSTWGGVSGLAASIPTAWRQLALCCTSSCCQGAVPSSVKKFCFQAA